MRTCAARIALALALCAAVGPSHASRTVLSGVMDYGSQVGVAAITVPPGAAIALDVTVDHPTPGGGPRWRSTSWRIGAGAFNCANHVNFDAAGTDQVTFNMTAPAGVGTYNVQLIAYADDACSTSPSATFTIAGGVTVSNADSSTVTASPASVPADGSSTSTITVTLLDSGGAPRIGRTVSLAALSGSSAISGASGPSNGAGVVTFTVSDTVAEAVTYRATNVTDGITLAPQPTVTFTAAVVSRFNAVDPGGNPATGVIFTKYAGRAFALDIVALQGAAPGVLSPGFTGTVRVEFVEACGSATTIGGFRDVTFAAGDGGRKTLAGLAIADAYRTVYVRMKYPAGAPTITTCSGDAFSSRPASLVVQARDANRTTAGTVNVLSAITAPGGPVHNAGRPFTILATAYNEAAIPAVTSRYDGTPGAVITACAGGNACTATVGTLTLGAWSAAGGTVSDNTARYDEVGAFSLQLVDTTYTATDAADGTPLADRRITSSPIAVGRFVPDAFALSAGTIMPRAAIAACAGSTFTYMSERMDVAFRLTAVNAAGARTAQYAGALARLDLSVPANLVLGAIDRPPPLPPKPVTLLTPRITAAISSGAWVNGEANASAQISIQRAATGPDGPYSRVHIGIAPSDADLVTPPAAALDLDADNDGTNERVQIGAPHEVRFGRLRLDNAHGSELIAMVIRARAQYWDGTTFVTNGADSCTPVAPASVALGNYQRNLGAGETTATTSGTLVNGEATLRLTAPGAANAGSVDVSVNLTSAAAGASCTAGMPASAPSGLSYLQGAWCGGAYNRDPTARATFGVHRNSARLIYQRENF